MNGQVEIAVITNKKILKPIYEILLMSIEQKF